MSGIMSTLEKVYAAAAFAECGDWETARSIASKPGKIDTKRTTGRTERPRPRARAAR